MEHAIPVDLYNPGQVFACLGFLEAADVLLGDVEGGFDWTDEANTRFILTATEGVNPFEVVLQFLVQAEVVEVEPANWLADRVPGSSVRDEFPAPLEHYWNKQEKKWTRTALPVELVKDTTRVSLAHWADGSTRNPFKLYSGNRSASLIAKSMLSGTRAKPKKGQNIGDVETRGIEQLWQDQREMLTTIPFECTPMGGSFNFDPRGAWTAIDAGYSPNQHDHQVEASPVVELLAACGLEHARPDEFETRKVRYAAWGIPLEPMLARAALCGRLMTVPLKHFVFELGISGKNKVVTVAELETAI